eukprot:2651152-Alexandrium_andersonii.AAC.1
MAAHMLHAVVGLQAARAQCCPTRARPRLAHSSARAAVPVQKAGARVAARVRACARACARVRARAH